MVQTAMTKGYEEGFAERGTGSHRRRCTIVEGHVRTSAPTMFKSAIKPVVDGLAGLRNDVRGLLKKKCSAKLVDDLRLNYSVLWEPVDARTMAVRGRMAHPLHVARMEVCGALHRLKKSQEGEDGGGGDDDGDSDDEIQDVTNAMAKEKRAAQEVIDLGDDDDDEVMPPAAPAKQTSAPGRVKPERAAG